MSKKRIPITVAPDGAVLHTDGVVKEPNKVFDWINYVILGIFAFCVCSPL